MSETTLPRIVVQVKAFHPLDENIKSLQLFIDNLPAKSGSIFVSAPYTQIESLTSTFSQNGITVGANEMVSALPSSFTGSIAGRMVNSSEARFVLIPALGANAAEETEVAASKEKVKAALKANITPYITLNETWEEHHDGLSKEAMSKRLRTTLEGLSDEELKKLIIVYSAQWILGGLWEASSSDLSNAYKCVAETVKETFPEKISLSQLIISVPSYSIELSSLIATLQRQNEKFLGFLCGDLGPGTTQMHPLFVMTEKVSEKAPADLPTDTPISSESPSPPLDADDASLETKDDPPAKKKRTRSKPATEE